MGLSWCARRGPRNKTSRKFKFSNMLDFAVCIASYPGLLPPPRAHAPYVLIMRRWFFGGRRPGYEATVCTRCMPLAAFGGSIIVPGRFSSPAKNGLGPSCSQFPVHAGGRAGGTEMTSSFTWQSHTHRPRPKYSWARRIVDRVSHKVSISDAIAQQATT